MKILLSLIAMTTMLFSNNQTKAQIPSGSKVLVAYYSYSGNTRVVAEMIREATGGDIFEIVPQNSYPTEYQKVVDQAKKEIEAGERPALKTTLPDIGQYDVIIVGSPCWWATVAPPVATFLAGSDLSGKTIAPFMTHEGSGMGRTGSDIKKLCPGSTVLTGLPIRGHAVKQAQPEVEKWLQGLKPVKK